MNNKWGYIDRTSKFVIDPKFTEAAQFLNGMAQVTVDDKLGYINRKGEYIWIPR